MYVLIHEHRVVGEAAEPHPVHSDHVWVDVGDAEVPVRGSTYDRLRGTFTAPSGPDSDGPDTVFLRSTDRLMPRASEDLIDTLVGKGVITPGDLPAETQQLLNDRKAARARLSGT